MSPCETPKAARVHTHPMGGATGRLRVFIVEDEGLVAMLIEDMLTDLGHEIAAVAARMEDALRDAKTGSFDFALLDVNLDGTPSYPIADILKARGIPFVFATGYGPKAVSGPAFFSSVTFCLEYRAR